MQLTKITSRIIMGLSILFLLGLLALLFAIPSLSRFPLLAGKYTSGNPLPLAIFLYIGAAAAIFFMVNLFLIMRRVSVGDPFRMQTVHALTALTVSCFIAFLDFSVLIIAFRNFTCFGLELCAVILLFGALCCSTLTHVFAQAVSYKAENDLTI